MPLGEAVVAADKLMHGPSPSLPPNVSRLLRRALHAHADGAFDKAERLYGAVLRHHPHNFEALHGLGCLHYRGGRLDTALALTQAALQADRGRADGFATLGLIFHAARRFKEALLSYDEGLRLAPDDAELRNRRGVALLELGRPNEALDDFERALAADPDHFEARGNFGNALLRLNRPAEALAAYDRALTAAPANSQLLTNRAVALRRLDRPHEALMSAQRALAADPDFAQARFVESVARLTLDDFTGWRGYESRWSVGLLASQRRNFAAPLWLGEQQLAGKTILLHAEQGSGDTIQFVRYAPLVARCGAAVIVEVQAELARLLGLLPGVAAVIARGQPLPRFDFHCPLLSLPLALATQPATIPADIPYVSAAVDDMAAWRRRLPPHRPLIGVVWSGAPSHDNDLNRSMRLEALAPLLDCPDAGFVSLQHRVRQADVPFLQSRPGILPIGAEFRDFADTAAAIACLDMVIAVDTAVAHLAGAMGKPLLLLLPFAADFRWLRERHETPWYPTARLYRQPQFGDWASVVDAVRQDVGQAVLAMQDRKSA